VPVIIPPGFGQATFVFTGGPSDPMANVLGYSNSTGLTATQVAQILAAGYASAPGTYPLQYQAPVLTFDRVMTRQNQAGVMNTGEHPMGLPGGATGEPLPWNTSVLLNKRTSIGGRRHTGRWYYMGGMEAWTSDGAFISSSVVTLLSAAFGNFYADIVANGVIPHLLHTLVGISPTLINDFSPQVRLASQRGRLR